MSKSRKYIRETWESPFEFVCEFWNAQAALIVILREPISHIYRVHRYFPIGNEWHCSVDDEGSTADNLLADIPKHMEGRL